jgi:hypothetical protein
VADIFQPLLERQVAAPSSLPFAFEAGKLILPLDDKWVSSPYPPIAPVWSPVESTPTLSVHPVISAPASTNSVDPVISAPASTTSPDVSSIFSVSESAVRSFAAPFSPSSISSPSELLAFFANPYFSALMVGASTTLHDRMDSHVKIIPAHVDRLIAACRLITENAKALWFDREVVGQGLWDWWTEMLAMHKKIGTMEDEKHVKGALGLRGAIWEMTKVLRGEEVAAVGEEGEGFEVEVLNTPWLCCFFFSFFLFLSLSLRVLFYCVEFGRYAGDPM